ncbi:MAG: PqqD family protein [Proteobacteria bacterium]|nr:PqqD family protein [Pseudomonadota bacterium]MBU1139085.1 PqqD family protein [Pseudomonadota bacterium]MBU1232797.1 PqqD family protein [Pseudomonadota bacterium]MBU1420033.1 PqqD family protein [Pseudomonadota bacterium]MBU1454724.1 PqqD family protein [Pseudomonadota bacterium]
MHLKFCDMSQELLRTCIIKQADGKLSTEIDGETVMMDLNLGVYSSFNSVASHIWKELEEGTAFFPVLESILENFNVDRETAHKELTAFLDELSEKDLIQMQTE